MDWLKQIWQAGFKINEMNKSFMTWPIESRNRVQARRSLFYWNLRI